MIGGGRLFRMLSALSVLTLVTVAIYPASAAAGPKGPVAPEIVWSAQGRLAMAYALERQSRLPMRPGKVEQPAISHDGRYVAFLWRDRKSGSWAPESHLWLSRFCVSNPALPQSSCDAHEISSIGAAADFAWSPTSDQFVVEADRGKTVLVNWSGVVTTLPPEIEGLPVWAPNGRMLAVTQMENHYGYLDLVRNGVVSRRRLPALARYSIPRLASFWGAGHILYWVDPLGSASIAADGMQLVDLNLRTNRVRRLGMMLGYQDWLTVFGSRLLMVRGDIRSAFFNKYVQLCYLNEPCRRVAGIPKGDISFDPAWSPNGQRMTFVVARSLNNTWGFRSGATYVQWLRTHVLWVAKGIGTGARPIAVRCHGIQCVRGALHGTIHGVDDPEWTPGGIVVERLGGLWFLRGLHAVNALPIGTITTRLIPRIGYGAYENWYYGHLDWRGLFDAR